MSTTVDVHQQKYKNRMLRNYQLLEADGKKIRSRKLRTIERNGQGRNFHM